MDADVIVVGDGPVGLMLAAELRLAGARPLVLERLPEPSRQRKARGIGPLAAEALRRRGLGEQLAEHHPDGRDQRKREHGSEKDHFAWIHKIDPALQQEPDRRGVLIWQPDLEAILAGHAARLGVPVLRDNTVTGLTPYDDHVDVTVETPAGPRLVRAAYVVGCDGGRSSVRKLAGFDFPGTDPIMTARQARVQLADADLLPPPGRTGRGTLLHAPGNLGTFDFAPSGEQRDEPVTKEELEASVRRVAGVDITITELSDALRFTDGARQASTYRLGRILLAGDAAHVHSPNGGQGLNLGLMDAVNLGWKLAAEVRGQATAGLLDTYNAERHPIGAAVLQNTRAQSALLQPGPHMDALRDIFADLMDLPEVNRYLGRLLSGLSVRYAFPDDSHPLVGCHCPDLKLVLAGKVIGLSDLTHDGDSLLLAPVGSDAFERGAAVDGRLRVVPVDSIEYDDLSALLIRPDGVVAWAAGPTPDLAVLDTALSTWFRRNREW